MEHIYKKLRAPWRTGHRLSGKRKFRLWNADEPQLWDEHGWIPYQAVKRAESMYQGKKFDPGQAYDLQLALALIEEER